MRRAEQRRGAALRGEDRGAIVLPLSP